ncbi:MAG: hypothetical protein KGI37_00815 [Alphaproteobacteria bacterium]|nr:hypothetical protein [Alphaproteobacteria bacterium]
MMKKIALPLIALALSGCTTNQGTFTVMSNKIVNVSKFDLGKATKTKDVVGEDKSQIFVLIPTKTNPNLSDALTDAFRKSDGDVMTDVTVTSYQWYIPYIYGEAGWKVEGDVIKTRTR